MIAKKYRLTTKEFAHVFANGTYVREGDTTARYTPSTEYKVAVVVSGKVTKHKPTRNRMRRRVYIIARHLYTTSHITGMYILLIPRTALTQSYNDIARTVTKLLQKTQHNKQ